MSDSNQLRVQHPPQPETHPALVERADAVRGEVSGFDYHIAFQRNLGLVSAYEQGVLRRSQVALLGAGGVGGVHALALARLGIGALRIVDPDHFELANFNRQFGALRSTLGQQKAVAVARQVRDINPAAEVEAVEQAFSSETAHAVLADVDLVIDGLDLFALDARRVAYAACRERGIPVIASGPIGMSCSMLLFTPDGMTFERYYDLCDGQDRFEQLAAFVVGTVPALSQRRYLDLKQVSARTGAAPSLGAACCLCAGAVGIEALRVLLGRPGLRPAPHYYQFDAYRRRLFSGCLRLGNRSPLQRLKRRRVAAQLRCGAVGAPDELVDDAQLAPTVVRRGSGAPAASSLSEVGRALAEAARCAPSADNTQPWSLSWERGRLRIAHRVSFDGDALFGPGDHGTLLSVGAATENVRQTAVALGLEQAWRFAGEDDLTLHAAERPYAEVLVTGGQGEAVRVPTHVLERHTNRAPFSRVALDPKLVAALEDLRQGSCRVRVLSERADMRRLATCVGAGSVLRFTNRQLHHGLATCLRFTAAEVARGDGLDVRTLHLPPGALAVLRRLCDWRWMTVARWLGAHRLLAAQERQSVCASGGLVTIVGPHTRTAALDAGQLMQRAWLLLNAEGVAVQPTYAAVDPLMRAPASARARRTRALLERELGGLGLHSAEQALHMVLRVGLARQAMPRSRRLPLSEVLSVHAGSETARDGFGSAATSAQAPQGRLS